MRESKYIIRDKTGAIKMQFYSKTSAHVSILLNNNSQARECRLKFAYHEKFWKENLRDMIKNVIGNVLQLHWGDYYHLIDRS